ncbi:MAG: hypothetical protein V7L00_16070 [Nostoc sp.]
MKNQDINPWWKLDMSLSYSWSLQIYTPFREILAEPEGWHNKL